MEPSAPTTDAPPTRPALTAAEAADVLTRLARVERELAELRAARPKPWSTPADLAARLGRSARWWQDACACRLVPDARKHPDSGKWLVPAGTVEEYARTGVLPVLPKRVRVSPETAG